VLKMALMTRNASLLPTMRLALLLGSALALAGCQRDAASQAQSGNTDIFTSASQMDEFALQVMTEDELADHDLAGDYGCAFSIEQIGEPLMVARVFADSPDSRAEMLVKYGESITRGFATEAGGSDAIAKGGSFDTAGLMVDVALTEEEPAGRGESPPYPAMIRVTQPVYGEAFIEGFWTCGANF